MGINGVGSYQTQNYTTQNRSRSIGRNWSDSNDELIGNATSLSGSSNNGKKIGVTTVGDKGYIAMYADCSTEQDPVVKVGDYEVRVKNVNPNNATKMEMFALMSYLDDQGLTNNQGMKSFNKMTAYASQAEYNGYCSGLSDENAAWTEERDWIAILGNAKESFYKNPQTYEQGLECEKIIDNLKKYTDFSFDSGGDYISQIHKKIEEMQEKIDNDEVNESFQIGGQTFTIEEWDEFLKKFDSIQDAMEALMKERHTNKKVASKEYSAEEIQEAIDREVQSNQHKKKSLYEMLINTCPEGTNATFRFAGESKIYSFYEYIEELQRRSGEISVDSTSAISNTRRTEIKVSNFKEYETANYKFVPEPTIGKGGMRILKNGQSVAVFSVDNLKIRVDEQTGTRVLISEIGGYNGIWYDAISVDAELENGLAEAIGVDDIPEVALEGYYIGTHAGTGIQYVMKPGEEGRGGKILFKSEADVARYNALAEEYYTRYPNLIESQEEGRIWASFEILGMAERTASGIVSVHPDNISYNDNSDYKNNWSIMLNDETWELLYEWLEENRNRMEEMNKFSSWRDILDEIGGSYERIWSKEELDQGYLNN